jgi:hypothetical protein
VPHASSTPMPTCTVRWHGATRRCEVKGRAGRCLGSPHCEDVLRTQKQERVEQQRHHQQHIERGPAMQHTGFWHWVREQGASEPMLRAAPPVYHPPYAHACVDLLSPPWWLQAPMGPMRPSLLRASVTWRGAPHYHPREEAGWRPSCRAAATASPSRAAAHPSVPQACYPPPC